MPLFDLPDEGSQRPRTSPKQTDGRLVHDPPREVELLEGVPSHEERAGPICLERQMVRVTEVKLRLVQIIMSMLLWEMEFLPILTNHMSKLCQRIIETVL